MHTWKRSIPALMIAAFASTALACNVPVFRYALERWKPDLCEVIVFHSGELSESAAEQTTAIEKSAQLSDRAANIEVRRFRTDGDHKNPTPADVAAAELWKSIQGRDDVKLPYVIVRSNVSDKRIVNGWRGELAEFEKAKLLDSPARRELSRRLLSGDSVVWILLKSSDAKQNDTVKQLLTTELKQLSKTIEFPEGLGLPGSELYSELPLLMQFTILEIANDDPDEQFLVKLFEGFQPEAVAAHQPLIIPVFGRGRALEVVPADRLDAGVIGDLTRYLCGACSCQVKERNPGFDLLLSTKWDRELFGEGAELPPPPKEYDPAQAPVLLTIPPGKGSRSSAPNKPERK